MIKLNWIPLLSFWEASPGPPSRGSSSASSRPSRAGFRSGMPVAEAMLNLQLLMRNEGESWTGSHHEEKVSVTVRLCGVRLLSD